MAIERLERISNYRIFRDYSWPEGLYDFSQYNLFYGWNGAGKTTLSSIFYAMQKKQSITSSDVWVKIDGKTLHGKDFDSIELPPVRVFNRDTVDRTLFEDPHLELPPVYYLGEESAEKQRLVVELKEENETANNSLGEINGNISIKSGFLEKFSTEQAAIIKNLLTVSGGGPYNNYDKRLFKHDAEKVLANQINGFCLTDEEKERCVDTKNGVPLDRVSPISLPDVDYQKLVERVDTILKRSVVSKTIAELIGSPDISSWVQRGLHLHTGENATTECHFCKQPIPDWRISELEDHFSDQLKQFQGEIDAFIDEMESYIKTLENFTLPDKAVFYPHLRDSYVTTCSNWSSTRLSLLNFLKALISALKKKRDEPFKRLDISDVILVLVNASKDSGWIMKVLAGILDFTQNVSAMMGVQSISKINQLISEHNTYTDEYSLRVKEARKNLAVDTISRAISDYQKFKNEIAELEKQSLNLKDMVSRNNAQIIELERDIRVHRKAAEELNEEMNAYLGRDELKFEVSENGYKITRNGESALHLSEGERTAISFMYFLKTLEDEDFNLAKGIVVIDDPISSLDANSMYSAFGFMKEKTKAAKQLFIMTHSFNFFRQVRGWFLKLPKMNKKDPALHPARLYLLECIADGGSRAAVIKDIDPLLRDYESEYHFLFKTIYTEAHKTSSKSDLEQYYGLPNIGRRVLESFLTFKLPHFDAGRLEKKMEEVSYDSAKKTRILRFLNVNSHADQVGEPEHDISILSETKSILLELLELIKTIDKDHFDGMISLIGVSSDDEEVAGADS